jgi:hypothetical protein
MFGYYRCVARRLRGVHLLSRVDLDLVRGKRRNIDHGGGGFHRMPPE